MPTCRWRDVIISLLNIVEVDWGEDALEFKAKRSKN